MKAPRAAQQGDQRESSDPTEQQFGIALSLALQAQQQAETEGGAKTKR
jgi:hypothetical protein